MHEYVTFEEMKVRVSPQLILNMFLQLRKNIIFKFGKVEMAPKKMKKTLTFCPLAKVAYS